MQPQTYKLPKNRFLPLLEDIINNEKHVIAPVKTDAVRFQQIQNPKYLYLKSNTNFPLKELFFQKEEPLFEYNNDKNKLTKPKIYPEKKILFGIRRCDLNAIYHQDIVYLNKDYAYTQRRKNTTLIGYHCNTPPNKYCFCGSLDLINFYDIMIFEHKDKYILHVQTKEGHTFMKKYQNFVTVSKKKIQDKDAKIPGSAKLRKKNIDTFFNHPDWEKGAKKCYSCSACTALCPTCLCYEICDKPCISSPHKGKRIRSWSSCQLQSFTRVAGDHVFRKSRLERFKHRIYHQLDYFKKQHGTHLCVGCGRCISECPTRIDFVSLINSMK